MVRKRIEISRGEISNELSEKLQQKQAIESKKATWLIKFLQISTEEREGALRVFIAFSHARSGMGK
jgi:hypothetical protein